MEPCIYDSIGRWSKWRDSFASALCADRCSPPSSRRRQRSSALHLDYSSLAFKQKVQVARLELAASSASPPVAVPYISSGTQCLENIDRCHSLRSLLLPLAALPSLPQSRSPALLAGCPDRISPSKQKSPNTTNAAFGLLVQVARLELAASCSQSRRATNCATPGYCYRVALYPI